MSDTKLGNEFIGGKEALQAILNGDSVQYKCDKDPSIQDRWTTITKHYLEQYNLAKFLDGDTTWKFRLEPKTVYLEMSLPKPFKPKVGDLVWILDGYRDDGYTYVYHSEGEVYPLGAWRTEDEIELVVEKFGGSIK